jgi:hypothetical protein
LAQSATLNQRGKLFALIGRHTFSAAINFATLLEDKTETIFVGEPTGAGPNHYGDATRVGLPHSKMFVAISSLRHEFGDPNDFRDSLTPDVPVEVPHRDYFSHHDAAVEAALAYRAPPIGENSLDPTLVGRYAGRYSYDSDRVLSILNARGGLKLDITGLARLNLYPISEGRFRTGRGIFELTFELNKDSNLDEIRWSVAGRSRVLQRLPTNFKTPAELLQDGRVSESAAAYRRIKRENPLDSAIAERALNNRGYGFLGAKQYEQALNLFELNVEFYPGSSNAWDSLGEANMLAGNKQKAAESYRRSLDLNPDNTNAKRMLKKLL